jgi:hypothetical protein
MHWIADVIARVAGIDAIASLQEQLSPCSKLWYAPSMISNYSSKQRKGPNLWHLSKTGLLLLLLCIHIELNYWHVAVVEMHASGDLTRDK